MKTYITLQKNNVAAVMHWAEAWGLKIDREDVQKMMDSQYTHRLYVRQTAESTSFAVERVTERSEPEKEKLIVVGRHEPDFVGDYEILGQKWYMLWSVDVAKKELLELFHAAKRQGASVVFQNSPTILMAALIKAMLEYSDLPRIGLVIRVKRKFHHFEWLN